MGTNIQNQISIDKLLDFLSEQETYQKMEFDELMALPLEQRIVQGHSLDDLTVSKVTSDGVWLDCGSQIARYRRGDHILLTSGNNCIQATVLNYTNSKISVQPIKKIPSKLKWTADPVFESFLNVAQKATQLIDSMRGQFLFDVLNGEPFDEKTEYGVINPESVLEKLEAEAGMPLDPSQRQAFISASCVPKLWALQGPPGTGKTGTAAFIGEALLRESLRVIIVTQSHEAVNRVLAEWGKLFKDRRLIKIEPSLRLKSDKRIESFSIHDFLKQKKNIVNDRPVIGMTVHTALLLSTISKYRADIVIVDEASQTPLTHGALLGVLGFSVLLFGDPCQLGAIFPQAMREQDLAISLMDRYCQRYNPLFLEQTHRLNAPLADVIGRVFYPDERGVSKIVSTPKASLRKLEYTPASSDACLVDVLNPAHSFIWAQIDEVGNRQCSKREAHFVSKLVHALIASNISINDIAVVTPFRQQVQLIQKEMANFVTGTHPVVGTTEIMQGQSVEVVLVSVCVSDSVYLDQTEDFFFSPNRWNVALSRARTKVIIVASMHIEQLLQSHKDSDDSIRRILSLAHPVKVK